jgi:RimJ/RimL family protein N-acetyltransferase
LIGICAVHPWRDFELGYWLGEPYWGKGYATEAGRRVARFAFEELGATQLLSAYMHDNPASGRVLVKLGFLCTHDETRPCVSRAQEVLHHRMALTRARFLSNVTP